MKAVVGGVAAAAMLMPMGAAVAAPSTSGSDTNVAPTGVSNVTSSAASTSTAPSTSSTVADASADGPTKVEKTHTPKTAEESFMSASDVSTYGLDAQNDDGESGSDGLTDGTAHGTLVAAADLDGLATVGVTWKQQDMTDMAKAPKLELRYFKDNAWSEWQTLPSVDDDLGEMGSSPAYYVGLATEAEARLTPVDGQTITEAKFITVDPGYSAVGNAKTSADVTARSDTSDVQSAAAAQSDTSHSDAQATNTDAADVDNANKSVDSGVAASTAVNTVDNRENSVDSVSATASATSTPSIRTAADAITSAGRIHTREEWWKSGNPARAWKPDNSGHWQGAVVHHTYQPANNYTQAEVPALINGIYVYHNTSNGWGDIGYNLLVDKYGGIWEGRDEGVDNQVVPASNAVGAHARGFNTATFGVVVLGDFTSQAPSEAAINSVSAAIAWEFNALGITNAKDTFEYKGTQPRITGHGDKAHWVDSANNTACPGQKMWDRMDDIRTKVQSLLDPAGQSLDSLGKKTSVKDGEYYILSAYSGKTLDIAEASKEDNAAVEIWDYNGNSNQIFQIKQVADGKYTIAASHSDKVLDAAGPSSKSGTKIIQYSSNGGANQEWEFYKNSQGYTFIKSVYAADKNRVLDVTGAVNANGSLIELWNANGGMNQQFRLVKKGDYKPGVTGWVTIDGEKYWYNDGIRAASQEVMDPETGKWYWMDGAGKMAAGWVDLPDDRHVYYDPTSYAMAHGERSIDGYWYYFDTSGNMAHDEDVWLESGRKWVRYDSRGHMLYGEDYRYSGWYYFDPQTGAMAKGWKYLSSGGKWVYYDMVTGQMLHGEAYVGGNWYYFDDATGATTYGWKRLNDGRQVYYDMPNGWMLKGWHSVDGRMRHFDEVTGAVTN
ncbi:RICIN domain-containing protein [Bifidobacterium sp. UTCIF-39]|uniref:RICIN domain-containing protein n=1 Tax=Bifidobacterium sp. UTCIF-39 TaxID=1465359 RepID=UPI0015E3CB49|nr:RICIN domain-containing protein [Bifidobacterium sp. UTCIF-39]